MTVPRTQHQPMILEPNRAAVAVDRRMPHIEDGQDTVPRRGKSASVI
jgi:hypothetical protein